MPSRQPVPERLRAALEAQRAALGEPALGEPALGERGLGEPAAAGRECVRLALTALDRGGQPLPEVMRGAARHLLDLLAARAPGRAVEVRVPPYAAAQCVEGPRHTRGTPPNVVETDPVTWLELATGRVGWSEAVSRGRVAASGPRADLAAWLPVL